MQLSVSATDRERSASVLGSHGIPILQRSRDEVAALFDGLELIEPGVVAVSQWRPESGAREDPAEIGLYCAVARKP